MHEGHAVGKAVGDRQFARDLDHAAQLDGVDVTRAGPAGEKGEQSRSGAQVNHHVAVADRRRHGPRQRIDAQRVAQVETMLVDINDIVSEAAHLEAAADPVALVRSRPLRQFRDRPVLGQRRFGVQAGAVRAPCPCAPARLVDVSCG